MNDEWYFCLTPDFSAANRSKGLFLPNTVPTNNDNRFWYNLAAAAPVQVPPDQPPALAQSQNPGRDKVGFAIEVTQNITPGVDDYSVDAITLFSSTDENPRRPGATAATQASPFKQGSAVACIKSGAPGWILQIAGRTYYALGPFPVAKDGARNDTSSYELDVAAQVSRGVRSYQFSYDPEMDVDNS
jgi:hypothetical protein